MRKAWYAIVFMIIISPLFGIILANMVGYHEPLDVAAEMLHLKDISDKINWTPFYNYTVPGLPDTIGYIISGVIGVTVVYVLGKLVFGGAKE